MACSHTHMFATCLIICLSIKRYEFTGRDMPLQKSSGVAILVSLQECGVSTYNRAQENQLWKATGQN